MARDVLTVEEDVEDDSAPESMESDDNSEHESDSEDSGPENKMTGVDAGATVNFMHDPVRKQSKQKVVKKKKLTKKQESLKRNIATAKIIMGLVKPDAATDREKERYLRKIATQGVVQLFNAVAERQSSMSQTLAKKMNAKQRKEAADKFKGTFDVRSKRPVKEEEEVKEEIEEEENYDLPDLEDAMSD